MITLPLYSNLVFFYQFCFMYSLSAPSSSSVTRTVKLFPNSILSCRYTRPFFSVSSPSPSASILISFYTSYPAGIWPLPVSTLDNGSYRTFSLITLFLGSLLYSIYTDLELLDPFVILTVSQLINFILPWYNNT